MTIDKFFNLSLQYNEGGGCVCVCNICVEYLTAVARDWHDFHYP